MELRLHNKVSAGNVHDRDVVGEGDDKSDNKEKKFLWFSKFKIIFRIFLAVTHQRARRRCTDTKAPNRAAKCHFIIDAAAYFCVFVSACVCVSFFVCLFLNLAEWMCYSRLPASADLSWNRVLLGDGGHVVKWVTHFFSYVVLRGQPMCWLCAGNTDENYSS